jgi:signal transduction histidine kinase/ActR/RegA family two-component response regulator
MRAFWRRWPDDLIPESTAQRGTEAFYRARLVVIFSVVLAGLVFLAGAIRLALDLPVPAGLNLVQSALLVLLVDRFRRGLSLWWAANGLLVVLISSPALLVLGSGASLMVPVMCMVLFPVLATALTGPRGGIVWSLVATMTIAMGLILEGLGVPLPLESRPEDWLQMRTIGMSFLMGFSVFVAWVTAYLKGVTLDELEAARRKADAASAAKSRFLANMSHEIRTPLNGVLGTGRLLQETRLDTEQRHLADTVVSSGEALLELLDGVLDLSKIEANSMSLESIPTDLSRIAGDVVGLMGAKAGEKGLALQVEWLSPGPFWILGDPTRLRQILLNLVGNAIKFTAQGGVTVSVGLTDTDTTLSVADTGIGIDPARIPDLFEEFTQADTTTTRQYGGTGLGLAITHRFVLLMGGRITVESTPGAGTVFTVSIPSGRCEAPPASEAVESLRLDGLRVLVAEDHPVNQLITRKMLERAGCEVTIVEDGAKAVQIADRARFDVVLMDCHMPVLDGFAAARAVRDREGVGLPIIALTAAATTDDQKRCFAAGMDDYLTKPVSLVDLTAALARFGRHGAMESLPKT